MGYDTACSAGNHMPCAGENRRRGFSGESVRRHRLDLAHCWTSLLDDLDSDLTVLLYADMRI